MKKKIIGLVVLLVLSGILIFLGISNYKEDTKSITIAEVTHSIFYAPMYVAIENGYFDEYGIDVELLLTPGADKVSAAVLSGDAQIGFAGAESAMYVYAANKGDYLQIISGLTKRDGQFIVSRNNEDFDWNKLKGKEILVGRISGMPALNFLNALDNKKIDKDELNINASVDFASLSGAFIGGEGDYVNLFEPNATLLEKQGYGYVVDSIGKSSLEFPYTTFYAKKSYIKDNRNTLKKFTYAIAKGLEYVKENDETVIANAIHNQFIDTDIEDLKVMIKRYKDNDVWLDTPVVSEKLFNNLNVFLLDNDLIKDNVPFDELVVNLYK